MTDLPPEPTRNDTLESLAPVFRAPWEAWLAATQGKIPHVEFRTIETRRTLERQRWLYAQGRPGPFQDAPRSTWTIDSRHRWGLAADWIMLRRDEDGQPTNQIVWSIQSYKWVYRVSPPEPFGLRHLAPAEWMHVELLFAEEAIEQADRLKLHQT